MKRYTELSIEQLQKRYATNIATGLSSIEAQRRLKEDGPNRLPEPYQETWLHVFFRQFQSPLIYILIIAAFIIFFVGNDPLDAFIISGVLLFNAVIGTIQEGRTRSILQSLRRFVKTTSIVVRDGKRVLVDDVDLVPGDVILLQEGQKLPADAYVIEANMLQVDEAILTGESRPIYKTAVDKATQGDDSMVYKGTYILSGSGKALIYATGVHTEVGSIHTSIEEISTDMPLKKEIDRLSYWLLAILFVVCLLLFVIGVIGGQPLKELLVMLTALFICVVPEGLPVVMTLVLVSGVYRMAKRNVLVKHMQAVEGLGRADVLAIDKTGTLTRNELIVKQVSTPEHQYDVSGQGYYAEGKVTRDKKEVSYGDDEHLDQMVRAAYLMNATDMMYDELHHTFEIKGDPTEAALYVFAQKICSSSPTFADDYKRIYEVPFDPKLQYHLGLFDYKGTGVAYIIGAPERVAAACKHPEHVQDSASYLLEQGLRIVATASKIFDLSGFSKKMPDDVMFDIASSMLDEKNFTFHGVFGIQDTIRPEVSDMVIRAKDAGLQVVMATGDHKDTALYVAKTVGIFKDGDQILTGAEFLKKDDQTMADQLNHTTVYARVLPKDKMRLIKLYHQKHKVIAMTGDGINDAPALVAADLGIAMGGIGTEVAKQAADIILLDDSFANIVRAIEQGRHIFYTLKRVILYFFATNMGEILIILFALIMNAAGFYFPLPLTAAQILWLNLVTDGFLDIAISMEPQEPGLLQKKWLQKKVRLIDMTMALKVFFYALPMAIGSIWLFFQYYQTDIQLARTMTLVSMAMFQWFNAWNCRSDDLSLFQIGLFSNRWLLLATSFVLFLQILLVYVPSMQYVFKTVPLSLKQWLMIAGISFPIIICDEIRKAVVRYIWPNISARSCPVD